MIYLAILLVVALAVLCVLLADPWESRGAAEKRADELLRACLGEEEYGRLATAGYLEVPSSLQPDRLYRIPKRRGPVAVYERGTPIMALCVQPVEPLPRGDTVLLHKLLIEGDEERYLRVARPLPYRYGP